MEKVYFLSGIDTDAGKTYATAMMARYFMDKGLSVITQKFVQTGCDEYSEDIVRHRELLGTGLLDVDLDHTTAPVIFSYPASAQLAARIDGREIDLKAIDDATARLTSLFDIVIIEGAGGLMVPLTDDFLTIDYIVTRRLPVILVTNGVLGSINHTILSLEALEHRGIDVPYVVYNKHFDSDKVIAADTHGFIERYLKRHHPSSALIDLESIDRA